MKLQNELQRTIERMAKIKTAIIAHGQNLKAQGGYNDFDTRLAWDALRGCTTTEIICEWYGKYECTDAHITTMAKAALKKVLENDNK